MLRLESIELHGFKSFADRTRLQFPPGITCIVGPNGCGKSNIADAVAWVLGEQSAKSLRGDRMDDVIFGGSNGRKPRPFAEVTMNWIRLEALENEDENRLVISRRLAKNGFSEYTMNQAPCRLKDIQSALMDFGMGTKAYTIVQQGKIGHLLNAKPLERRSIIEEAAGILKYKLRRDESEIKLKTAEDNLLRINDIIREVQKRRGQLNRQVGKARRYKKLKERFREVEKVLLTTRIHQLSKSLREIIAAYEKTRRREMKVNSEIAQRDAQVTSVRRDQILQEKTLRRQENELNQTTQDITLAEENSKFNRERIAEKDAQLGQLEHEKARGKQEQRDLKKQVVERMNALQDFDLRLKERASRVAEAEKEEATLAQRVDLETDALETCRRRTEKIRADRHGFDVEKRQMEQHKAQLDFQKAATEQRIFSINKEIDGHHQDEVRLRAELQETDTNLQKVAADLKEQDRARHKAAAECDAAKQAAENVDRQRQRLEDKLTYLTDILRARTDVGDATKTVLQRANRPLKLLRDVLDSKHRYDAALDWILEPYSDCILVTCGEDAAEIDASAQELGIQRLDLRHPPELKSLQRPMKNAVPALEEMITEPDIKTALTPLIGHMFIVPDDQNPAQKGHDHPESCLIDATGQTRVQGAWLESRQKQSSQSGFLTLKGELDRTDQARIEAEHRWEESQEAYTRIQEQLNECDKHLESTRTQRAELEKTMLLKQQGIENRAKLQEAARANLVNEQKRAADLEHEIDAWAQREKEINDKIAECDGLLQESVHTTQNQEEKARQVQQEYRAISARLLQLREKYGADQTQVARIKAEHEHLLQLDASFAKRQEQADAQRGRLQNEIGQLKAQIKQLQTKIETALTRREKIRATLQQQEQTIEQIVEKAETLDREIKELHSRRDDLRAEEGRYELENARISSKIAHLQEKHQANCGFPCDLNEIDPDTLPTTEEAEDMDKESVQLQTRLDNMGAVNLLAIDEFEEVDERYQFLIDQQKDLLDSITEIRSTIHKLNKVSSDKFVHAFDEINKRFSDTFRQLFGGGRARMALVDEDNVLESGVDLLVQPPGKKLQSVTLMSGGEKALTAIALLLAIFEFRPSPFCLFDEVDAPLDEANITRFLNKLEALKDQTQFILITHQKSTMAAASSLFGVTMEEGGCSKLVSVAFD